MKAISLCSTMLLPYLFLSNPTQKFNETPTIQRKLASKKRTSIIIAAKRDAHKREHNNGGQLVDGSMIHLRKRIEEMRMIERNYGPPEEWAVWEKQYYTSYNELVCKVVGLLQSHLIKTRPSLALGMIALVTLSVPTSVAMLALRLMEVTHSLPINHQLTS